MSLLSNASAIINTKLTKEQWEAMSEEQKKTAVVLGFQPPKEEKPKERQKSRNPLTERIAAGIRNTAPAPYPVKINEVCICCKSSTIKHGIMDLPYAHAPYLKYRKLTEEDGKIEDFKFVRHEVSFCSLCEETLMQYDKELLVQMIIQQNNFVSRLKKQLKEEEFKKEKGDC